MNVLVTLNPGLGSGLGPNFLVYSDIGTYTYNITLTELLNGIELTFEDTAGMVIIESLGECPTIESLIIGTTTTTSTSTSTTTTTSTSTSSTTTTTTTLFVCALTPTIDYIEEVTTTTTTTTVI